jgi:hypothetical protein
MFCDTVFFFLKLNKEKRLQGRIFTTPDPKERRSGRSKKPKMGGLPNNIAQMIKKKKKKLLK